MKIEREEKECRMVKNRGEEKVKKERRRSHYLLSLSSVCTSGHLASIGHHVLLLRRDIAVRYASHLKIDV